MPGTREFRGFMITSIEDHRNRQRSWTDRDSTNGWPPQQDRAVSFTRTFGRCIYEPSTAWTARMAPYASGAPTPIFGSNRIHGCL